MEFKKSDKSFFESEKETEKETAKTILRKGKAKNKPIELDSNDLSINDIYGLFQSNFGNKNFMGTKQLNQESLPIFMDIMDSIDISNIDSINKSLADIISKYRKQGIYFIAPKSTANFKTAIIETIKAIDKNNPDLDYDKSTANKTAIDKKFSS